MLDNRCLHLPLNFYDMEIRQLLQLKALVFAQGANHLGRYTILI